MPLAPYANADGSLNLDAAIQQLTGILTCYRNDREAVEQMLALTGGGSILYFNFRPESWPPSVIMYRQGNRIYVNTSGTVNAGQWFGDAVGVFAGPYSNFICRAHSFFLAVALAVEREIRANLPNDWQQCELNFSGHSYGGAVSFLLATSFAQDGTAVAVRHMSFQAPKALTFGYNGALPIPNFNVIIRGDMVPAMPPNGLLTAVVSQSFILAVAIPIGWRTYCETWTLETTGSLAIGGEDELGRFPTPTFVGSTIDTHNVNLVASSLVQTWTNQGIESPQSAINDICLGVSRIENVQPTPQNVDALSTVDIPFQNVNTFLSDPASPLTLDNLRTTNNIIGGIVGLNEANPIFSRANGEFTGMPCKLTFFYTDGLAGFSESWYVAANDPQLVTVTTLRNYVNRRMAVSGSQTKLEYIRVSTVGTARQVKVYVPADLGANAQVVGNADAGAHNGVLTSDFGGVALLCRKYSGLSYSRLFLRGVPDGLIQFGGQYLPNAQYQQAITNLATFLFNNSFAWRGVSGNVNPPALITSATANADGTYTFGLGGNLFQGIALNTTVVVRISGQVSPRNMNGQITVVVTGANACRSLRQQSYVGFVAGSGRMTLASLALKAMTDLRVERVVSRKPGRPFGLYRGRARNRVTG